MAHNDPWRECINQSDRMHALMDYADSNRHEFDEYVRAYVDKHRALGVHGTFISAHTALDNWLKRGWTIEAATRRVRARSELDTLQEQQVGLPNEEWRIIVVCILLNMTHGRQVRPMIDGFWQRAPGPLEFCRWQQESDGPAELKAMLRPLGFSAKRQRALTAMSDSFLALKLPPEHVTSSSWAAQLPGVGPYALDSLDIFRYGRLTATTSDTWLNAYCKWRRDHDNP